MIEILNHPILDEEAAHRVKEGLKVTESPEFQNVMNRSYSRMQVDSARN